MNRKKSASQPPLSNGKPSTPPPGRTNGGITVLRKKDDGPPPGGGITVLRKSAPAANGGITVIRKSPSAAQLPGEGANSPLTEKKAVANGGITVIRKSQSAQDVAAAAKPALREFTEEEVRDFEAMWGHLTAGASESEREGAAVALAGLVKEEGVKALNSGKLMDRIVGGLGDTKNALVREGSLLLIKSLCEKVGHPVEPYLVPLLPQLLLLYGDKWVGVRQGAQTAAEALMKALTPQAVKHVLPILFEAMENRKYWQAQEGSLKLVGVLAGALPDQIRASLPDIVPKVSDHILDGKTQVMDAAYAAMCKACATLNNRDIAKVVPSLVSCIARPNEVPDTVYKLSGTTFIQAVTSPTLSVLVPLLVRGLKERTTLDKRRTVVVIENMSKLVVDAIDAAPFIPLLLPGLEKVSNEVADPECRATAGKAHKVLSSIAAEAQHKLEEMTKSAHVADHASLLHMLKEVLPEGTGADAPDLLQKTLDYVTSLCLLLVQRRCFEFEEWTPCFVPFIAPFLARASTEEAEKLCRALMTRAEGSDADDEEEEEEDDEEGEDLCNCKFSLGYGGKILLNNARLHLKRGHRYGLCGANGCGKSTLMRSIAKGKLDGFPPPTQLRTIYVAHDLDASEAEQPVTELLMSDPLLKGVSLEEVTKVVEGMGFSEELQKMDVGSLSGGWKMKLALGRAMLMKADILLLDEPTNHLDVTNVAWLEHYLNNLEGVSSMIVSHDSGFLDNVCTDIIHYEKRKLHRYKGNLSKFVEKKPEAKVYYDLSIAQTKITFPPPGQLDGITRRESPILKLKEVEFTYDGASKPQLSDVNLQLSMSSRVSIRGPNGAGKTTLVKIITGQVRQQQGTVWKHPNLGIAYVAQHAFHHVEKHLDMSPNEYIRWRYERGEDKEEMNKVTRKICKEEQRQMEKLVMHKGVKRNVEKLLGRRKYKKTYEYEVKWVGMDPIHNSWMTRAMLEEMGFQKMIHEVDALMVAKLGLYSRPLTIPGVQAHLSDFGLEPEFGTYGQIKNLSGGQKVKVVLAAAMWANPHLIVLDEPTNYLDREALGALATAIQEYQGAVVIISHNGEFAKSVCSEEWHVGGGQVIAEGNPAYEAAKRRAAKEADKA